MGNSSRDQQLIVIDTSLPELTTVFTNFETWNRS